MLLLGVTIFRRSISLVSPCRQLPQPCCSRWTDLASHLGKLEAMAKTQKSKNVERARKALTVAHRERLIEELRVDPKLAAEYLNAAAKRRRRQGLPRGVENCGTAIKYSESIVGSARAPTGATQMSITTSLCGREQQIRTFPSAGGSSGSGR